MAIGYCDDDYTEFPVLVMMAIMTKMMAMMTMMMVLMMMMTKPSVMWC